MQGLFTLPARHLAVAESEPAPAAAAPMIDSSDPFAARPGLSVMILEDQLVIAIGLEQILNDAHIEHVITASSEQEALQVLEQHSPDAAILDVNLGRGTSIAVAEALMRRRIPFLFATGYGDGISIPAHLKHIPVTRKPYDMSTIVMSLRGLLEPQD